MPAHRKPVYSLAFKRRKIHMTAELFGGLPRETLCGNRRAVVKSAGSVSAEDTAGRPDLVSKEAGLSASARGCLVPAQFNGRVSVLKAAEE